MLTWLLVAMLFVACASTSAPARSEPRARRADPHFLRWPTKIAEGANSLQGLDVPCVQIGGEARCYLAGRSLEYRAESVIFQQEYLRWGLTMLWRWWRPLREEPVDLETSGAFPFFRWPNEVATPFDADAARGTCVLRRNGTEARCWGGSSENPDPHEVVFPAGDPARVIQDSHEGPSLTGMGAFQEGPHACAIMESGRVRCWGAGSVGQLGDGHRIDHYETSVLVMGISNAEQLALGAHHTCALLRDGTVRCWGYGIHGQLGDGEGAVVPTPVEVIGVRNAAKVYVGAYHSCALSHDGVATCWGDRYARAWMNDDDWYPNRLQSVGAPIVELALGGGVSGYTCALDADGTVWCGGYL